MAKKFVRGITDVKTINNQDFDTNNVNDLLSDGQYNYIHRKKGKSEEYHNLTDNIKTLSSDNTELLAVTNYNKTTNTATLHPKHDKQKEQVLESTRNTVTIHHGTNGTAEKTSVDTNPQKVLEHEKLKTGDGLATLFSNDETTIMFKATKKAPETNVNSLGEGIIWGSGFANEAPQGDSNTSASYITIQTDTDTKVQLYIRESIVNSGKIIIFYRFIKNGVVTNWKQMSVDNEELLENLALKQDKLTAGTGITIDGQTIDTNPQKVLEHENLISDSEYITLNHQTGENVTHIKTAKLKEKLDDLQQNKQNVLTAGTGITIEGNTISASGGGAPVSGASVSFQEFGGRGIGLYGVKHTIDSGDDKMTQFTFECAPGTNEFVITGALKEALAPFIVDNIHFPSEPPAPGAILSGAISSGAITITISTPLLDGVGFDINGTTIKLVNSNYATENVFQQETFTFYKHIIDAS